MSEIRRWGQGMAAAVVGTTALFAIHAPGHDPVTLADTSWARWDSGLYYTIAREGYSLNPCPGNAPGSPTWCGTAGWFPGYPAIIRFLGTFSGAEFYRVGALVAILAWLVTIGMLGWSIVADAPSPTWTSTWPAWLLLAVFPGAVYYRAVFPISLATAGIAVLLTGLRCERPGVVAIGGALATVAYPSGVLALVGTFPLWRRAWRREPGALGRALIASSGPILGYLAVVAYFQIRLGRWNAWFLVQEKYGHGLHDPVSHLWSLSAPLRDASSGMPAIPALQTLLVAALVVAALMAVVRLGRQGIGQVGDVTSAAATIVAVMWLAPLTIGGQQLSLYRAEALLVPLCVLWPSVRGATRWVLPVAAVGVFVGMTGLFFTNVLV